jgi:hypothetical protein
MTFAQQFFTFLIYLLFAWNVLSSILILMERAVIIFGQWDFYNDNIDVILEILSYNLVKDFITALLFAYFVVQ